MPVSLNQQTTTETRTRHEPGRSSRPLPRKEALPEGSHGCGVSLARGFRACPARLLLTPQWGGLASSLRENRRLSLQDEGTGCANPDRVAPTDAPTRGCPCHRDADLSGFCSSHASGTGCDLTVHVKSPFPRTFRTSNPRPARPSHIFRVWWVRRFGGKRSSLPDRSRPQLRVLLALTRIREHSCSAVHPR